MSTAAQVSLGGRDFVLENGPDVMNSSDEDSKTEEHGEVLTGMYMNCLKAPILISKSGVARQKAAWSCAKSQEYGVTVSDSPQASGFEGGDSSDADLSRSQSVFSLPAPSNGGFEIETSGLSDTSESDVPPASQERKNSGKKGSGKKAATRHAEHPMATRSQEVSRAGGLRPVVGSGQTDTCVANGNPSKT
jgi:hypothetical protein